MNYIFLLFLTSLSRPCRNKTRDFPSRAYVAPISGRSRRRISARSQGPRPRLFRPSNIIAERLSVSDFFPLSLSLFRPCFSSTLFICAGHRGQIQLAIFSALKGTLSNCTAYLISTRRLFSLSLTDGCCSGSQKFPRC